MRTEPKCYGKKSGLGNFFNWLPAPKGKCEGEGKGKDTMIIVTYDDIGVDIDGNCNVCTADDDDDDDECDKLLSGLCSTWSRLRRRRQAAVR